MLWCPGWPPSPSHPPVSASRVAGTSRVPPLPAYRSILKTKTMPGSSGEFRPGGPWSLSSPISWGYQVDAGEKSGFPLSWSLSASASPTCSSGFWSCWVGSPESSEPHSTAYGTSPMLPQFSPGNSPASSTLHPLEPVCHLVNQVAPSVVSRRWFPISLIKSAALSKQEPGFRFLVWPRIPRAHSSHMKPSQGDTC